MAKGQSLQDPFLNALRRERIRSPREIGRLISEYKSFYFEELIACLTVMKPVSEPYLFISTSRKKGSGKISASLRCWCLLLAYPRYKS